ncbi:MAG TPA: type II toxin-antitoxin system prevent-host-death family antitoxin [Bryobacteraceae bacterium]|nr:type II toxin-antitoxin system prevent-host-death family antitoxin [Bryobacteraceae bacterium]
MAKLSVSIRELQQNLKSVMDRVERGQIIEITRRRRPIARLGPLQTASTVAPWPDLDARARAVFGTRMVRPSGSQLVAEDRGQR